VPYELLDVEGCVRHEPALGLVREKLVGGLRLPGDEAGDYFKFTNALAALCRQTGVESRSRRATLEHVVTDLCPRGGDATKGTFWCGLRPMTPDGPSVIATPKYPNLWLNTGHGTLGWTMSCGSGRVLADMLSGRKPEIDVTALSIGRYARVA
jgi:glycine/D-amino acid oxidase-like deaminating enzyme